VNVRYNRPWFIAVETGNRERRVDVRAKKILVAAAHRKEKEKNTDAFVLPQNVAPTKSR